MLLCFSDHNITLWVQLPQPKYGNFLVINISTINSMKTSLMAGKVFFCSIAIVNIYKVKQFGILAISNSSDFLVFISLQNNFLIFLTYRYTILHLLLFLQGMFHIHNHELLFLHMRLLGSMDWIHMDDEAGGSYFHIHFQSDHEGMDHTHK